MQSMLPNIWKSNGEFDVYKMINRYQTLANYQARTMNKLYEDATDEEDIAKRLNDFYSEARFKAGMRDSYLSNPGLRELELHYVKSEGYDAGFADAKDKDSKMLNTLAARYGEEFVAGKEPSQEAVTQEEIDLLGDENGEGLSYIEEAWKGMTDVVGDTVGSVLEQAAAEIRNGSQWVTWKVNGKDSVSHSFSNGTKEPEISSTINGLTSKARSLEVNTSGGKTGIAFADAAVKGVKNLLAGGLDALHLTGLMALYNSSVIDFPDVWDSSDMGSNDFTFTIPLRAWSGNDLDVFQDLIVPTAFWIAKVCPLATGKQSYTHPFYLEAYARGRFSARNAIVTSLSINCGVGNMGWRPDGVPLGIDISVTIKDLSKAMFMPIVTDSSVWDTENKFSDFMGTLGAMSLHERTNGVDKAVFNFNKWKLSWKSAFSVGARTNQIMNVLPARVMSGLLGGTSR
jgi:hypothetical protein